MLSIKNKIVQEGIKVLLKFVYKPVLSDNLCEFRLKLNSHNMLLNVKNCKTVSWYIQGNIEQQFQSIDHNKLFEALQLKIKDQLL